MVNNFPNLLSPIKVGKLTIKNRFTVSPMGDNYHTLLGPFGEFSQEGIDHIIERGRGGYGLYMNGVNFFPDNKVDPFDPNASVLDHKDYFRKQALEMNERAAVYNMKVFQQITMGLGRNWIGQYSCSENPYFDDPSLTAPALTKDQIKQKIDCMVEAAALCKDSGFAGVEVHALHWGYLLDQFAMSITNHRTDEYGGSLENRLRVCKEILDGIKSACGKDFPVSMRLALKTYIKGFNKASFTGEDEAGRTLEEGLAIAKLLESWGYDMLNVDAGIYDSFYYACPPSYMPMGHVIDLAAECKKVVDIPVFCGSKMNDPVMCEEAIAAGKIDGVVMGRQSLADPFFPKKVEMGVPEKIRPCIGCIVGCMNRSRNGEHVTCAVNPLARRERDWELRKTMYPKKVAVIGGGIAGMQAAMTAKTRGHDVKIYEKGDRLGGALWAASAHGFKNDLRRYLLWAIQEVESMDIPVEFNANMTPDAIKALQPDVVILTTGADPLIPPIPGVDKPICISAEDLLLHHTDPGESVVVVGGGLIGCETAVDLAMQGKKVTLVEAAPAVLAVSKLVPIQYQQMVPDMLDHYGVDVKAGNKLVEITDEGAIIAPTTGGDNVLIKADKVIMSVGRKAGPSMERDLYGSGIAVYTAGDMNQIGLVYTSVRDAFEVARGI